LPRPNFLVVDEGFGTADAESLSAMPTLFGFLRSQFDFILIMSHLDSMKDMVDGTIEIRRENDFSIVNFS
jgi:DNA repair exonuclease SbcCD ATPase subunit